jgi:ABC-2 type transport system permease protein
VTRTQIMIGRTLGGATVAVFQGTIVFILALVIGFRPTNTAMLPLALLYMGLIAIMFTALGTAVASFIEDMQGFQLIINFLIMPTFFLSGALFPLTSLPKAVAFVSSVNPLTYGVDGLRGVLVNGAHLGLLADFAILLATATLLMAVGSYLFSRIEA